MNKLNPKIKIGCPICSKILQDELSSSSFKLTEPKYNKNVSIIGPKKKQNGKTISLF